MRVVLWLTARVGKAIKRKIVLWFSGSKFINIKKISYFSATGNKQTNKPLPSCYKERQGKC